jgi:hypothetical protein
MYVPAAPPPVKGKGKRPSGLGALPILAVSAGAGILKGITKTPSEKRAAKVLPAVVASAMGGNLTALKAMKDRSTFGISKERAVWLGGYNKVASARPDLVAALAANLRFIPRIDNSTPESAASSAIANAYFAPAGTPKPTQGTTPAAPGAPGAGAGPGPTSVTTQGPSGPIVTMQPPPVLTYQPPDGGFQIPGATPTAGLDNQGNAPTPPGDVPVESGMVGGVSTKTALIAAGVVGGLWWLGSQRGRR